MKKLVLLALMPILLCGCQTLNLTCSVNSGDGAKLSGTLKDSDVPTTSTSLQGNVPLQGGTVSNPVMGK